MHGVHRANRAIGRHFAHAVFSWFRVRRTTGPSRPTEAHSRGNGEVVGASNQGGACTCRRPTMPKDVFHTSLTLSDAAPPARSSEPNLAPVLPVSSTEPFLQNLILTSRTHGLHDRGQHKPCRKDAPVLQCQEGAKVCEITEDIYRVTETRVEPRSHQLMSLRPGRERLAKLSPRHDPQDETYGSDTQPAEPYPRVRPSLRLTCMCTWP